MAGDVFFTDTKAWSASSNFFCDIMGRAIRKSREDKPELVRIFSAAEEVRCLGINLCKDRGLRAALTEQILCVAREKFNELRTDPLAHQEDTLLIKELIDLAEAHLSTLRDDAPD